MELARKKEDGTWEVAHYSVFFPGLLARAPGPNDEFLEQEGVYKAVTFIDHDVNTTKLEKLKEPEVGGLYLHTVKVVPLTKEELQARTISANLITAGR